MAQVGEPALAVDRGAGRAPGRPSASVIVSVSDATPSHAQHPRPVVQPPVDAPPSRPRRRPRPARRVQPRNGVSAAERARGGEVGRSIASSSRSHSRAGGVPNTLPAPLMTAGTPTVVERVADQRGVAVACARARRRGRAGRARGRSVAPSSARISISAPEDSSATRSAARSCAMCSRADALLRVARAACADRRLVAVHDADAQRRRRRGARQARRLVGVRGADAAVDDPLVAELGAAEQRVVGVDQPLVAAPVDLERRARAGGLARPRGRRRRRRRGTRRSPASGRRSARASRRRRRTRAA